MGLQSISLIAYQRRSLGKLCLFWVPFVYSLDSLVYYLFISGKDLNVKKIISKGGMNVIHKSARWLRGRFE